jgi:hypothetical protein
MGTLRRSILSRRALDELTKIGVFCVAFGEHIHKTLIESAKMVINFRYALEA